jgi:hypothetical protein
MDPAPSPACGRGETSASPHRDILIKTIDLSRDIQVIERFLYIHLGGTRRTGAGRSNNISNSGTASMQSIKAIKPAYLFALVAVIALVIILKMMNPYRKYGTQKYWESATLESVGAVPDAALKAGNKNGPVLMWASISTSNPEIIGALVQRGADINERDAIFSGTPLTGAAGYSKNPEIIRELIKSGADINIKVLNGNTALMIAAMYNTNTGIIEELVFHGADIYAKNAQGESALGLARKHNNTTAEKALLGLMKSTASI